MTRRAGRDPGTAINNGDNGSVSQESREQDKYFENQATKTNVTILVAAREIHSVDTLLLHTYEPTEKMNPRSKDQCAGSWLL